MHGIVQGGGEGGGSRALTVVMGWKQPLYNQHTQMSNKRLLVDKFFSQSI